MGILNEIIEKLFKTLPVGLTGVVSVTVGMVGIFVSSLFFPGYNFLERMISDLGAGPGALFFNGGLILSGIIGLPFAIYINLSLKTEDSFIEFFRKISMVVAIVSCISLSLIGCFPAVLGNDLLLGLHGISTATYWLCCFYNCVAYSIFILKVPNYPKNYAIFGFFVSGTFLLVLLTWLPITEWIMTISFNIWIFVLTYQALYISREEK